jgi:ribose/xylose/arabinose/galactoside ABC-type transport system permease subunit
VNTTSPPLRAGVILSRFGFPIVLVGIFVAFSVTTNGFLTLGSLSDMAHDMAPLVVISAAEAFVVMSGKLDISVGSIAFLSASLASLAMRAFGIDPLAALLIALAAGGLMGAANGAIVVALRVNALIATLGTMIMFRGIGLELTDAGLVPLPERVRLLGNLSVGPLFVDVVVAATVLFAVDVLHRRTRFGRQIMAVGNGEAVASDLGIPVRSVVFRSFVLCGVLAALGGVLTTLQVGAVTAYLGNGLEFNAVAVVVVGGISLFGGRGNLLYSVALGALTFEMIRTGLNYYGANPYSYRLVGGAVIFIAMYADALKRGRLGQRRSVLVRV